MYKIPANTLFLGKNLVFMPECHSTNSFALQLCQQSPSTAEGTLVITANQTAGRGQRGSVWRSDPGKNLTFSIVLKPTFLSVKDQFYLNIFPSLAIHDYLKSKGCPGLSIKWPNDVLVGEKKACGILIENQLMGNLLSNTVIGIGLNINQSRFEMDSATSLFLSLNQEFELQSELEMVLGMIEARYLQLRRNELSLLMSDYLGVLYWLDKPHSFSANGKTFTGTINGIDRSGGLRIKIGELEEVFAVKEITYVR